MRLITIRVSHYNERARWALDRFGVSYVEEPWMPALHFLAVMWATRGRGGAADRVSTRFSTPLLITDDGERLGDSGLIVRWSSDRFGTPDTTLYPERHADAITAFEQQVHDEIGPHTRRIAYWLLGQAPALLSVMAQENVGPRQAAVFERVRPVVMKIVHRGLRVDGQAAQRSIAKLRERLRTLDEQIGDRSYLFGDRFTAADLTIACMLAPALLPSPAEGFGAFLPAREDVPEPGRSLVQEVRQSAIGRHCLRMFANERGQRRVPCVAGAHAATLLH